VREKIFSRGLGKWRVSLYRMTLVSPPSHDEPVPGAARVPEAMNPDARRIIAAALAGDEAAFEDLIRLYSRRVYAVAYAVVQDAAEAEDIVQETFLKAHQGRMRDTEKFSAWLLTVARNAARDRLRRRKPRADEETFHALPDDNAAAPGAGLERREFLVRLHRALGSLPEEHRTALTLRYLEGLDHRAIEQTMGLSNGALRGILGRALGTLRRMPALATERVRP
jgi:RNA polymerase sigma-70 factor (ECF subfamily)